MKKKLFALPVIGALASNAMAYDISGLDSVSTVLTAVSGKANDALVPALVGLVIVSVVIAAIAWFARKGKPKG